MGKWLNQIREKDTNYAPTQGDKVDTLGNKLTMSTMSPHTSRIVKKKTCIDVCKVNELKMLVKKISAHYGGDDEHFLMEYINDILSQNDTDALLICFRDLVTQIQPVNNRK